MIVGGMPAAVMQYLNTNNLKDVVKEQYIAFHPCINTSSLKIKTCDIFDKFLKAVDHEPIFVKLKGED